MSFAGDQWQKPKQRKNHCFYCAKCVRRGSPNPGAAVAAEREGVDRQIRVFVTPTKEELKTGKPRQRPERTPPTALGRLIWRTCGVRETLTPSNNFKMCIRCSSNAGHEFWSKRRLNSNFVRPGRAETSDFVHIKAHAKFGQNRSSPSRFRDTFSYTFVSRARQEKTLNFEKSRK